MRKTYDFLEITYLSKILLLILILLCFLGFMMQYSAGGGYFATYSASYLLKALIGFIVLFLFYRLDIKLLFLLTDYFYYLSLFLLVLVELVGVHRLGAQRWLSLGLFVIQPSEIMKIAIVLMLSKHFHQFSISQIGRLRFYLIPICFSLAPFLLIAMQPDLGTALLFVFVAAVLFFLAGFRMVYISAIVGSIIVMGPIIWMFVLHSYQKNRILTFLNPNRDPLGQGYHIIQSKIAIGSGGFWGKGFLIGTQGQLDFLPEKNTDFIFTLLSEEFGFLGGIFLIFIYASVILITTIMSYRAPYAFGRYVIVGFNTMFFLYIFINIGMVSGLLPVVGVPLPFISFGGTSMVTQMIAFGIILNIENNKHYI
jgi:rod shape determining protein RodA